MIVAGLAANALAEPLAVSKPNPPAENARLVEPDLSETEREHWSFRPLERPSLPSVRHGDSVLTPVDQFLQETLEAREMSPLPLADRATLLRRLSFDLVGLPPSVSEQEDWLMANSPDAWDRLVDRLLASPAYGERWSQHWLDLARFAETDGFEHDKSRPNTWRFRDWVIEALNADLPYDQFLQFQLAGDELATAEENLEATGFCLSGPDMPDLNSQDERRHNLLNDMAATVGSALLGIQIGCAQCHDHKYDPFSQADFYRLRACFSPAVRVERDRPIRLLGERLEPPSPAFLMIRGDWRNPGPVIEPGVPRVLVAEMGPPELPAAPTARGSGRRAALARWLTRPDHPLTSRVIVNRIWMHHFGEGLSRSPSDFGVMGESPSHPRLLDWLATELVRREWSWKEMHRLLLTSAAYQRASRRVPPTAASGDQAGQPTAEVDPENRFLARFSRRRLEGEAIRDAMLAAAGVLERSGGGPGILPPLPEELANTLLKGQWQVSRRESDHDRRSIYVFARRNLRYPLFDVFDRPEANTSCEQRYVSTTAPQSLWLLNSEFSIATARRMATDLLSEAKTPGQIVADAYRRALGRPPTSDELEQALAFLEDQRRMMASETRDDSFPTDQLPPGISVEDGAACAAFCLALFNLNEFVVID